ncbi:membrane protein [Flexivirga endophytica]|uniref:Membrane protein n=1 Tax=Flexivirga endophytica TaxID=1849103 RepID=A0A916T9Q6_9MICO|nr:DUF2231 domain-containing protein [Flexivirga endophytica]GGB35296.1 membrane protein [Flexivirga endophytica]GHB43095.1 membrane protein [Flexivirga endophytica]
MSSANPLVRLTTQLEGDDSLDQLADNVAKISQVLVQSPSRRDLLQGKWLGHAVHPVMTMAPLGMWISAGVLDVFAGRHAAPAARKLIGAGLLCAWPTAVTGLAELANADRRQLRIGVVHILANTTGIALYLASYRARRRGRHGRGVATGLAGLACVGAGGYFGGHLASVRKMSSVNPAFPGV